MKELETFETIHCPFCGSEDTGIIAHPIDGQWLGMCSGCKTYFHFNQEADLFGITDHFNSRATRTGEKAARMLKFEDSDDFYCPECGHNLSGLYVDRPVLQCPECGIPIDDRKWYLCRLENGESIVEYCKRTFGMED